VRRHLSEKGVVAVNVAHPPSDYRLVDVIASTMASVFPSVYVIHEPVSDVTIANSLVVATARPSRLSDFVANVALLDNPLLLDVARRVANNVYTAGSSSAVLTDDYAPVEYMTHRIILDYLLKERK